jgi:hypothetical protein
LRKWRWISLQIRTKDQKHRIGKGTNKNQGKNVGRTLQIDRTAEATVLFH